MSYSLTGISSSVFQVHISLVSHKKNYITKFCIILFNSFFRFYLPSIYVVSFISVMFIEYIMCNGKSFIYLSVTTVKIS